MWHSLRMEKGFTLAELLISLAILGVIATFTIPKILSSMQNGQNVSKAKEVAAMISGAYQKAQLDGVITGTTKPSDLTPYFNYISLDTSGTLIDNLPTFASSTCNSSTPCLKLHNGGVLWLQDISTFGGTSNLNVIEFRFDPDASNRTTSTADGPLKAVQFTLYYDGFITTRGVIKTGSVCSSGSLGGANASLDPSWFTWR